MGADGVPGVVEGLLRAGRGGAVDEGAVAFGRPQLLAARQRGLEVAGHLDAFEDAGAENSGWGGGRVHARRSL
jgi:hypothetical protein